MSERSKPQGNMLMRVLSGVLGLGLIIAAVLYSTQVGKTNEANSKVSNLTLDLGTANGKISSLNTDLTASKDKVTSLTADLATANGKVTSLNTDLGAANAKVTTLTSDLGTANGRVTSLTADLGTANGKVTSLTADLATANGKVTSLTLNVTKLSADLTVANANVTKLSNDLAAAIANVTKLNADLAAANAEVTKLTADLDKAEQDAADLAAVVLLIGYPRHFNSVSELTDWLAVDDTNNGTAYAGLRGSEKSFILQVKALQDGLIIGSRVGVSSTGGVSYGNVAIVGGSIYAINPATDQIILEGTTTAYPLYPVPLSLH